MTNLRRAGLIIGSAALLVALFLVLRGRGDEGDPAGTPPVAGTTITTTTTTATATTTTKPNKTPANPDLVRATLEVHAGSAPRPRRLKVRQGRLLLLVVKADFSDEVHVHGYNRIARVRPGAPARLALRLDVAGIFEIELEERGLLIAQVEVRP